MADKLSLFIPEIWSANLLMQKEKQLVFGARANRNYEGDIKSAGDKVYIPQIGNITINSYTRNSTSDLTIQYLQDANQWLDIDQAKSFAFRVDDIDKAQSNVDFMQEATRKAGYALNDTADQFMAGLYYQCGITRNSSNSPVDMTSTNIEEEFLMVGQLLDEANAPQAGRYAIIPPWVRTKLTIAGIKTLEDNTFVYTNGFIGRAYGFDFYISNNVSKDSTAWADTKIICGIDKESFTFAEQLVKMETYRQTHEGFGDVVKGLHVYGGKVIEPSITACLFADYTAES